jgi:hypothetical protein
MAKLQSDCLTLDIKFMGFKDEWIEYEIKFYLNIGTFGHYEPKLTP